MSNFSSVFCILSLWNVRKRNRTILYEIFIKNGDYYGISHQFVSFKRFSRHISPKMFNSNLTGLRPCSTKNDIFRNEKYTGRVLLQKTVSAGGPKIKNNGFMERYLYLDSHEAIISDELFKTAQFEKLRRTDCPQSRAAIQTLF